MPFYDSVNDRSNFLIGLTSATKRDFDAFFKGYKQAADFLASSLLEKSNFSDYEAYPVAYLYRHALELSLKHIIHRCALLAAFHFRDDIEASFKHNHDLKMLSKIARTIILKFFPADIELQKALELVVETCAELSVIDGKSNLFRYPEEKKDFLLPKKWQRINLSSYASRMSLVLDSLDTIHFGLNIEIDVAQNVYENVQELIAQESQDEYQH